MSKDIKLGKLQRELPSSLELRALKRYEEETGRILISQAVPLAEKIIGSLQNVVSVFGITYTGSVRRMQETVEDIDIVAATDNPKTLIDAFTTLPEVQKVLLAEPTKCSVRLRENNVRVDLHIVPPLAYIAACTYYTGNFLHITALQNRAIEKGYTFSQFGLFKKGSEAPIPLADESQLYAALDLEYIPPELRENRGEIEASLSSNITLPKLVTLEDIRGDLHLHSVFSDGRARIEDLVTTAVAKGYEYIAITDHSLTAYRGLNEERLKEQWTEIDTIQRKYNIKILKGTESNINSDGSLDYPEHILQELDIVVGSVHTGLDMSKEEMTERIIKATMNPHLTFIGHPTGRLIGTRPPFTYDFDRVCKAAAEENVALEISSQASRLDLNDAHILKAKEHGVNFVISTDSHSVSAMDNMRYGVAQARRGWLPKERVINARPLEEFMEFLNDGRR